MNDCTWEKEILFVLCCNLWHKRVESKIRLWHWASPRCPCLFVLFFSSTHSLNKINVEIREFSCTVYKWQILARIHETTCHEFTHTCQAHCQDCKQLSLVHSSSASKFVFISLPLSLTHSLTQFLSFPMRVERETHSPATGKKWLDSDNVCTWCKPYSLLRTRKFSRLITYN